MTEIFLEDIRYLPNFQKNWVTRFTKSDVYSKFARAGSSRAKKRLLDLYLTELVRVLEDPRSEIAFLRKFLDRENKFVFVFDKARRAAKAKILRKEPKTDSSASFESWQDLNDVFSTPRAQKAIKNREVAVLRHILALGWENGLRLATILRIRA